ncbi:hypothetical protein M23134_05844 [Microscilla marina ATCC 23134]|uniref:Uncharacterized protein n=1 Tax=Microscilla marina ATCC 23134 TaxID=313606 RepID=A1ZXJ5_MICM2|nr:hypothetical protein M23134_05844 [Microscilla marina ATCC 23134]
MTLPYSGYKHASDLALVWVLRLLEINEIGEKWRYGNIIL